MVSADANNQLSLLALLSLFEFDEANYRPIFEPNFLVDFSMLNELQLLAPLSFEGENF